MILNSQKQQQNVVAAGNNNSTNGRHPRGFEDYKLHLVSKGLFSCIEEFEFIRDPAKGKSQLGMGSFGEVRLAQHIQTQQKYALKIMNLGSMRSLQEVQGIEREVRVHSELNHENIVAFYDSFQQGSMIYIVLGYATHGNLFSHIFKNKAFSEKQAFKYFYQTCTAISYLHSINVVHRDLKPENILLDDQLNVKLCDFGWCTEDIENPRNTFCGTYEYMAPEIVFRQQYDYRIDIWALGVLLFELLHGSAPFKGKSFQEIQKKVEKGDIRFAESVSSSAKSLICRVLQANPARRISIDDILDHKWIKQMSMECQLGHHYVESLKEKKNSKDKGGNKKDNNILNINDLNYFELSEKQDVMDEKDTNAADGATTIDDIPKGKILTSQAKRVDTDYSNKENLLTGLELSARKNSNTLRKTTASISKTPTAIDNNNPNGISEQTGNNNYNKSIHVSSTSKNNQAKNDIAVQQLANASAHKHAVNSENNIRSSDHWMNEEQIIKPNRLCFALNGATATTIMGGCSPISKSSSNIGGNIDIQQPSKQISCNDEDYVSNSEQIPLQESKQLGQGNIKDNNSNTKNNSTCSALLFTGNKELSALEAKLQNANLKSNPNNNNNNNACLVGIANTTEKPDEQSVLVSRLFAASSSSTSSSRTQLTLAKPTTTCNTNNNVTPNNNILSCNQTTPFKNTQAQPHQSCKEQSVLSSNAVTTTTTTKSNNAPFSSASSIASIVLLQQQNNNNNNNNISKYSCFNKNTNNNNAKTNNSSMTDQLAMLGESISEPSCFSLFGCLETQPIHHQQPRQQQQQKDITLDTFTLKRPEQFHSVNVESLLQQQQQQQQQQVKPLMNIFDTNQQPSSRSNSLVSFSTSRSSHEQDKYQQQQSQSFIPTKLITLKSNNNQSNTTTPFSSSNSNSLSSKPLNSFHISNNSSYSTRPRIANSYKIEQNSLLGNGHSFLNNNNNNENTSFTLNNSSISRGISRGASKSRTPNSIFENNNNSSITSSSSSSRSNNHTKGFLQLHEQQQQQSVLSSLIQQQKQLQESQAAALAANNNNALMNNSSNNPLSSSKRNSSRIRIFEKSQNQQQISSSRSSSNSITSQTHGSFFLKPTNIPTYSNYARIAL